MTEDNRAAALSDARETEREATERENAEVCEWLGIPALSDTLPGGFRRDITGATHYPALATREGRLVLEDALTKAGWEWGCVAYQGHEPSITCDAWAGLPNQYKVERAFGATPHAALYAAAVALMRRERGE